MNMKHILLFSFAFAACAASASRLATEDWVKRYVTTNTTSASSSLPSLGQIAPSTKTITVTDESNETYTVTFSFNGATNTALKVSSVTNMPSWFTNGMEFVRSHEYGTSDTNRLYVLDGTNPVDLVIRTVPQKYLYNGYWQYVTNGTSVVTNALYASTNTVTSLTGECVIGGMTFTGYNVSGTDEGTVFSFWSGTSHFRVNLVKTKKTVSGRAVVAAAKRSFWDCILEIIAPSARAAKSVSVPGYPCDYTEGNYVFQEKKWTIQTEESEAGELKLDNLHFYYSSGEVAFEIEIDAVILAIEAGKNALDPASFPFLKEMTRSSTPVTFENAKVADMAAHLESVYKEKVNNPMHWMILSASTGFHDMCMDKAAEIIGIIDCVKDLLNTTYGEDVSTDDYTLNNACAENGYSFFERTRTKKEEEEPEPTTTPDVPPPPVIVHEHGNWKGICGNWHCTRDRKCTYWTKEADETHPAVHTFVPASCNQCKWCGYHDTDESHHYGFSDGTWKTVGSDGSLLVEEHKCVCKGGEIAKEHEKWPLEIWAMSSEDVCALGEEYDYDPTSTFPFTYSLSVEMAVTHTEWNTWQYMASGTVTTRNGYVTRDKFRLDCVRPDGTKIFSRQPDFVGDVLGGSFQIYDQGSFSETITGNEVFHLYYEGSELIQ